MPEAEKLGVDDSGTQPEGWQRTWFQWGTTGGMAEEHGSICLPFFGFVLAMPGSVSAGR